MSFSHCTSRGEQKLKRLRLKTAITITRAAAKTAATTKPGFDHLLDRIIVVDTLHGFIPLLVENKERTSRHKQEEAQHAKGQAPVQRE